MNVKVLHIFGVMDIGGAELRTIDVFRQLRESGVTFDFLTLSGRAGVLETDILELGGRVIPLRLGAKFAQEFRKFLRDHHYDAVHSHVATFSGVMLALAASAGVGQRIAHFRSDGDGHPNTVLRQLQRTTMRRMINRFATDIVGVSPSSLDRGFSPTWREDARCRVIVNGIDSSSDRTNNIRALHELVGLSTETPIVLHVGRPSQVKNRPRVVQIFRHLRGMVPAAHLVFVGGNGQDHQEISEGIRKAGLHDCVHQLPSIQNARSLMPGAAVMLNTSFREGLPGVVLEAASVGVPVVSSDVPGARFIADRMPAVETLSLERSDADWAEVAMGWMTRAEDTTLRKEWAAAFRRSQFTLRNAAEEFRTIYRPPGMVSS